MSVYAIAVQAYPAPGEVFSKALCCMFEAWSEEDFLLSSPYSFVSPNAFLLVGIWSPKEMGPDGFPIDPEWIHELNDLVQKQKGRSVSWISCTNGNTSIRRINCSYDDNPLRIPDENVFNRPCSSSSSERWFQCVQISPAPGTTFSNAVQKQLETLFDEYFHADEKRYTIAQILSERYWSGFAIRPDVDGEAFFEALYRILSPHHAQIVGSAVSKGRLRTFTLGVHS